jgi:hypothetical protein
MINLKKKGQSETVGFVLIIIIVTIIILIFLYFIFRSRTPASTAGADMTNLLTSFSYYTTNCIITFAPQYKTGQELIEECYNNGGETCLDGRNVCDALNQTIKEVIETTLDVGPLKQDKAYKIKIVYYNKGSDRNITWFNMSEGSFANCTERYGGSYPVPANPGSHDIRLEVCKGIDNN